MVYTGSGPLILDEPTDQIDAALTLRVVNRAERSAIDRLSSILDATVRREAGTATLECDPQRAGQILEQCIYGLTNELRTWANSESPLRWLWFIRRLPRRIFAGTHATTFGYDRTLAEVISAHSTARNTYPRGDGGSLKYAITDAAIARICRFCSGIRFLSDLHGRFRWAGKGAPIAFKKGTLPQEQPTDDLRVAVQEYDRRMAMSGRLLGRLGSHFASPLDKSSQLSLLCVHAIEPMIVPTLVPGTHIADADPSRVGRTCGSFLPQYLQLEKLRRLIADPRSDPALVFTPESAAIIFLLACAPILVSRHFAGFHSVIRTGYLVWTEQRTPIRTMSELFDAVPEYVRDIARTAGISDADQVIDVLGEMSGIEWPLAAGPIIRADGDVTCVDLASATLRLGVSLSFPAIQGRFANARADHFEHEVQALLDKSDWAPSEERRRYVRKVLRRQGRDLTDIDAIGEMGGALLIVSCKSIAYSERYDIGDYSTIRNAASTAKHAVEHWSNILDELRANPSGDNYDFRDVTSIIGVVCTPQAVFVERGVLERESAHELPMLVSFEELGRWTRSSRTDDLS